MIFSILLTFVMNIIKRLSVKITKRKNNKMKNFQSFTNPKIYTIKIYSKNNKRWDLIDEYKILIIDKIHQKTKFKR